MRNATESSLTIMVIPSKTIADEHRNQANQFFTVEISHYTQPKNSLALCLCDSHCDCWMMWKVSKYKYFPSLKGVTVSIFLRKGPLRNRDYSVAVCCVMGKVIRHSYEVKQIKALASCQVRPKIYEGIQHTHTQNQDTVSRLLEDRWRTV